MALSLSACIITKNEEVKLPVCLKSIHWIDEVIVVDDFSTDSTPQICKQYKNVRFFQHAFDGFGFQKQRSVSYATYDWILNIDADEEATVELKDEIIRIVEGQLDLDGYTIRRANHCFGKIYIDGYPGALRLFRKSKGTFSNDFVHEHVQIVGTVGQIESCLNHRSAGFESYRNYLKRYVIKYANLAAYDYYQRGKRITPVNVLWKIGCIPCLVFIRELLVKSKWRQGFNGFFLSTCNAIMYLVAYVRLIRVQREKRNVFSKGKNE